jgi:hypothetical protein
VATTDGYVASSSGNLLVPGHAVKPTSEPVIYMPSGEAVALDCPPLPPGLGHLDEHAGRAVPWIAWRRPGGGVDIENYDGQRFIDCITERTCGMCALPLGYWLGFMVTAETDKTATAMRKMTEPPMHRPCAQYAAAAWWRDRTHLYVTRSFERRDQDDDPRHPVVCYAAPAKRVERFR